MKETKKIKAPLLMRLLDNDPYAITEKTVLKSIDTIELYNDIRINLQNILNARVLGVIWPSHFAEIKQSILNYGITDFTHSYFGNKN